MLAGRLYMVPRRGLEPLQPMRPLPPQGSVSTNSTTSANLLYYGYITFTWRRRFIDHLRDIILQRCLLNRNFQHRWIRQTHLRDTIGAIFRIISKTQAGRKKYCG